MRITNTPIDPNQVDGVDILYGSGSEARQTNVNLLAADAFVTPEMYGAYGDGTHDDTAAIQAAVDSGEVVVFADKTYLMNGTVVIADRKTTASKPISFDASASIINYTGNTYAFEIIGVWQSTLKFGILNASNGGCLFFNGTGTGIVAGRTYNYSVWSSQYVDVYFSRFRCKDYDSYCVRMEQGTVNGSSTWINEIRFFNGRFNRGTGIYLKSNNATGNVNIGSIRCLYTGFEGESSSHLKCGVRYDSSLAKGAVLLIGIRASESVDKIVDFASDGNDTVMKGFELITTSAVYPDLFDFTTQTYGEIIAPIELITGGTPYTHSARVCKGNIIPNDIEIRCNSGYSPSNTDFSTKKGTEIGNTIFINAQQNTVSTIKLPDFYGCQNGINDFYFLFSQKQENSGNGIEITQGNSVIMKFAPITVANEASGKVLIHCKWINVSDSTQWIFWKEDINTYFNS